MTIVEYFDPNMQRHLEAYKILEQTGFWPEWFIADIEANNLLFPTLWQINIQSKMAKSWLDMKLST